MRRVVALLFFLCLLGSPGCQVVRDAIFGGLAERYDSSRPQGERREAYDNYISEYADK